jgi:DNA-binding FadR family transcriptional regulator
MYHQSINKILSRRGPRVWRSPSWRNQQACETHRAIVAPPPALERRKHNTAVTVAEQLAKWCEFPKKTLFWCSNQRVEVN